MRTIIRFAGVTLMLLSCSIHGVFAAELLVIEQDGCPYCEKFNREIAEAYPNTSEGSRAPLRRIDLQEEWPKQYSQISKANLTPTFILVQNGKEIDRMIGYPGDEFFWYLLGEMLQKLSDES